MPTIHEEDEERDADELIIDSLYAELMSDKPLETDPRFEVERGDAPPMPVHTMPENTVLFMAEEDDSEIYIPDMNIDTEEQIADSDEIGPYVELCFTTDMAPVVLGEDQYLQLQTDEIATMRVYISANTSSPLEGGCQRHKRRA